MYLFAVLKPKDWKHDTTFDRMSNENYCDGIQGWRQKQKHQQRYIYTIHAHTHTHTHLESDTEKHAKWKWHSKPYKLLYVSCIWCRGSNQQI